MQRPSFNTDLSSLPPSYDVCSTAMKLEREVMVEYQSSFRSLHLWTNILEDVYSGLQPDDRDVRVRSHLIQVIDNLVKSLVPGSFVTPFGSYSMDLFSPSSDLDLSLSSAAHHQNLSKEYKISILKKLRRVLERPARGFAGVEAVMRATVPVIKFRDRQTGIECDLSVENQDGVFKSSILALVGLMDSRYRKLCYLVKAWAKAQNINDSKTGTVNSLSWILLVVFHLQTRSPPILPPFAELLEGLNLKEVTSSLAEVRNRVELIRKQQFGRNNLETIPELFGTFFAKLIAVRSLWEHGLCASTYAGRWVFKLWNNNHMAVISVEDFADFSNNAARAVQRNEIDRIYRALQNTIDMLSASSHDVESTAASLFGAAYSKKRPPQQLLAGPYDKRQKLTETSFRTDYTDGGQGDNSRGRQGWSRSESQGFYGRPNHRGVHVEGPSAEIPYFRAPYYAICPQNSLPYPHPMFQQVPDANPQPRFPQNSLPNSNTRFQQDPEAISQLRFQQAYHQYNPTLETHSRRSRW